MFEINDGEFEFIIKGYEHCLEVRDWCEETFGPLLRVYNHLTAMAEDEMWYYQGGIGHTMFVIRDANMAFQFRMRWAVDG